MAGVKKNFDFIVNIFWKKKYFEQFKNSIMILTTKWDSGVSFDIFKQNFFSSGNETQKSLKDRIFFYDPLNLKKNNVLVREEFLEELNNMDFIREKVFNIPFSLEEKLFLRNLFAIFEKEIFKKTKNKLFLEILTINENLDYFRLRKIKFIKKLVHEFEEMILPCMISLEIYLIYLKFS